MGKIFKKLVNNFKGTNIFICYHKNSDFFKNDILFPIQVGKALSSLDLNIIGDDIGDNISSKNQNYNELTALYWMYKNVKSNIVGLFHYRRFFDLREKVASKEILLHKFSKNFLRKYCIDKDNINKLMKNYDLILPKKTGLKLSLYNHYKRSHIISDLDLAVSIIKNKYPEMSSTVDAVLNGNYMHSYNMFIGKKQIIDGYCNWLFSILFEVEKKIQSDVKKRDVIQKRVYGYLGERLFNIYTEYLLQTTDIKIKYCPVIWINSNLKQYLKFKLKNIKRKILTFLGYRKEYWS